LQPPPKPVVRPTVCILGRPKSGKSGLATKLAQEYNLVHITVPIILESIVHGKDDTKLAEKVDNRNIQNLYKITANNYDHPHRFATFCGPVNLFPKIF
jgi:broad-specificity NMP kinase